MQKQNLQDYFDFDEADLAANRLGEFSDRQKRNLRKGKKDSKKSSILVGAILFVVGFLLSFLLIGLPLLQGAALDWVDLGNILASIGIPLLFLVIGASSLYNGLKSSADISEHRVASVHGHVEIVEVERATYNHPRRQRILYEIRVGGKEFNAYPDLPSLLIQGRDYTVYFDRADDTILSLELTSK